MEKGGGVSSMMGPLIQEHRSSIGRNGNMYLNSRATVFAQVLTPQTVSKMSNLFNNVNKMITFIIVHIDIMYLSSS